MDIVVCMKQVPDTTEVEIDREKGTLKREGVDAKTNLYDLYALELAQQIKERHGGTVTVVSMGPPQAQVMISEAYALGADRGILLSDRAFAGADTLATATALACALQKLGRPDLILVGMQTSDGDTAQVGPALAELLGLPHVAYVKELVDINPTSGVLTVVADMSDTVETLQVTMPALLPCSKEVCQPRLPSYLLKKATRQKAVEIWSAADISGESDMRGWFGLNGSPTRVEKVFPPSFDQSKETWSGAPAELAARLAGKLREMKIA